MQMKAIENLWKPNTTSDYLIIIKAVLIPKNLPLHSRSKDFYVNVVFRGQNE